jgi:hypothetical protein
MCLACSGKTKETLGLEAENRVLGDEEVGGRLKRTVLVSHIRKDLAFSWGEILEGFEKED